MLLLYKNGYNVGKYISVERRFEQTKDRYYDALQEAGAGWYEGESDSVPFIRYMVEVILACYTEFEECVGLMTTSGSAGTAYDIVKRCTEERVGKFRGSDVISHCPGISRSSALSALKRLIGEGTIVRKGSGRGTYYVRSGKRWACVPVARRRGRGPGAAQDRRDLQRILSDMQCGGAAREG